MVQLTAFIYKPHYGPDKHIVYSVDCNSPETASGFIQGCWKCKHCREKNHFRLYVDSKQTKYIARCPKCKKKFIAIDDAK
ncbi:hypothetical protein [Neobacillus ginsengisoli]|uniref:Zn finger protein HypA/HybF involved in hydrogenase expression n=1 Tax=Neobacillus ginsengisoli TaxID=904295 RepID=A0ABT9Y2J0_9BACI|nr:hypothetical protein [Neobacillus ginsengisoli]MDQ0201374.1 Zn finger protein HypA/HybF involved in hydrogenase expression [Neobacillus ginsengisoli]